MNILENKTYKLQTELGKYCRTGKDAPKTSINEHTFHYRRLVFGVVKDTMDTAFPLSKKYVGKKNWNLMVSNFFENHKCQTPQVWKLPMEMMEYYSQSDLPFETNMVLLRELLHYEWLEIEVFMMEDMEFDQFNSASESENDFYVPNPEIRILPLTYPIHKKKITEITEKDKSQYFVSIHRDFHTKQVRFSDLSYPFVEMILLINEKDTNRLHLIEIYNKYEKNSVIVEEMVNNFINYTKKTNILLGYKTRNY